MYLAIILIALGFLVRLYAIISMNGKFSIKIKLPDKLCTKGAYKYVRHPSYIGSLFVLCGISIISPVAGICYLAIAFFLARAVQEEIILGQFKEYREYQKGTGMFIPRIKNGTGNTRTK